MGRTTTLGALLLVAVGCESTTEGASSASASETASLAHSGPTPAAPTASQATSASAVAVAAPTPEEFCARAVALSERNYAKAPVSERENIASLNYVMPIGKIGKECELRVKSKNVEYHADAAQRCIEAAEKCGGRASFYSFAAMPECEGVLSGKLAAGASALFAEECGSGLSFVKNRCVAPVAKNGDCDEYPGGYLGRSDEHRCQAGLACFQTWFGADGTPLEFKCLTPQRIGERCKLELNQCEAGSSCYQGKCRAQAEIGGACMSWGDCKPGASCAIKGGVFGTCEASSAPRWGTVTCAK